MALATSQQCELCRRSPIKLTRHHLIPQSKHNKSRSLRRFSKLQMKSDIAMLCRPCHNMVHKTFSNQQLVDEYHSINRLSEHPKIKKFITWVQKRPTELRIRVK